MNPKTKLNAEQIDAVLEALACAKANLNNLFNTRYPIYYMLTKLLLEKAEEMLCDEEEKALEVTNEIPV